MEPQRRKLCGLHLVTIILLSVVVVSAGYGGVDHLAVSGGSGAADKTRATVTTWSPATIRRSSGHGHGRGHSHGHGHGNGNGNDRGNGKPETPTVFNPRTVTGGGNHHHGRNAAATNNPGRSCAVVAACCLFLGSAILLHFL